MIVVADASPLILLAKIGSLDLVPRLYPHIHISPEVYFEKELVQLVGISARISIGNDQSSMLRKNLPLLPENGTMGGIAAGRRTVR